jgi:hypothetical protein
MRPYSYATAFALLAVGTLGAAVALARPSSVVVMTNSGISASSFCTSTGRVTVVHGVQHDANGQVSFGAAYLSGVSGTTATYRLGPGNAVVTRGCYAHTIVSTTVVGNASARSTLWYD